MPCHTLISVTGGRIFDRSDRKSAPPIHVFRPPYTVKCRCLCRKCPTCTQHERKTFHASQTAANRFGRHDYILNLCVRQTSELVCDIQTEIAARAVAARHLLHMALTAVGKGYVAELLEHHLLAYDVLQAEFELEMAQGARE